MVINKINDNPISTSWKKRLSEQSEEIQMRIKALDNMSPKDYQLRVIKKVKNSPKEGDVFLISPREGVYFYGRVLKSDINHIANDIFIHGKFVIVIFKCKTKTIDISKYSPDYDELLIGPQIVDATYWTKGLFFTITNLPMEKHEKELDYGFYSIGKGKYFKEDGHELQHQPLLLGIYGIATITGIARNVEKELIIEPELLVFG
jgi:hypothetical protein